MELAFLSDKSRFIITDHVFSNVKSTWEVLRRLRNPTLIDKMINMAIGAAHGFPNWTQDYRVSCRKCCKIKTSFFDSRLVQSLNLAPKMAKTASFLYQPFQMTLLMSYAHDLSVKVIIV